MNSKTLFPLVLLFVASSTVLAQSVTKYVVQLGATSSIDIEKLGKLSNIGNVYFNPLQDNREHEILLGSFENVSKAEAVIQNLKLEQFVNAYVSPLPASKGKDVYVIQLAKYNNRADIDWGRFQGHGKIYTTIAVSYTHLPSPRDATLSRMPSSA